MLIAFLAAKAFEAFAHGGGVAGSAEAPASTASPQAFALRSICLET